MSPEPTAPGCQPPLSSYVSLGIAAAGGGGERIRCDNWGEPEVKKIEDV